MVTENVTLRYNLCAVIVPLPWQLIDHLWSVSIFGQNVHQPCVSVWYSVLYERERERERETITHELLCLWSPH